ncbi:MAG: methyltransferase domain-containing protein [Rhodobacter sp.]|nr:methyltransferase domain-containing protein [Paracoccaceae bacterium]MCC0076751.1 methyltransferase domain-containing protein [Rhodobacter sp.]
MTTKPDLSNAYALQGADDCLRLYAGWADSYDSDWAVSMDYRLPAEVAAALMRMGTPDGAVLDVGAGTGLMAAALRGLGFQGPVDAVDLSTEMLAVARQKGLYRALIQADITRPLPVATRYAAIASSGTFTHGHVGPEALPPLLDATLPGASVALSVNAGVWESLGFAAALDALGPRIRDLQVDEVAIYGDGARQADPAHAGDRALIVRFHAT